MNSKTGRVYKKRSFPALTAILLAASFLPLQSVQADSGLYVGGSIGQAYVELDDGLGLSFDEDDAAYKVLAGYNFDIIVVDLAVEAAYNDFGSPSADVGGFDLGLDLSGFSGFGLVGLELGPIGVFAKAGLVNWEAKPVIDGFAEDKESGTDPAYGVGARFSLFSAEIRAEYEVFDIDVADIDSSDLAMLSIGVVWTF
jgi:hypothetical protein